MDPATVQALRDAKSLLDEGILTAEEFASKKAELLNSGATKTTPSLTDRKTKAESQVPHDSIPSTYKKSKKSSVSINVQDCGTNGIIVNGDTFKARDIIKQLGGTWSKPLSAWIFAAGTFNHVVQGLNEFDVNILESKTGEQHQKELEEEIQAALALRVPEPTTLQVSPHKKAIIVRGETKALTRKLKALGGLFNAHLHGWVFSKKKAQSIVDALRADPQLTINADHTLGIIQNNQGPKSSAEKKIKTETKVKTEIGLSTQDDDDDDDHGASPPAGAPDKKFVPELWPSSDELSPSANAGDEKLHYLE